MFLAFLKKHHVKVRTIRMDNDVSVVFTVMLDDHNLEPEFAPRRNPAKRFIRTSKNHIIAVVAIIANTDPYFPMAATKHLIEQSAKSRSFSCDPRQPTLPRCRRKTFMYDRPYDFNRHPITPPGTRVVVLDKHHATWTPPGVNGFLFMRDTDTTNTVYVAIDYISCIINTVVAYAAEAK
jgi:hypothetical protein